MGETFVDIAATILESYGITPLVISEPAPTPAIAWEVMRQQGRWRNQLHGFAQSGGVQRNQVFYAGWRAGAAGVYQPD